MAYLRGIKYAVATAVISGFSIFINKFAVDSINPPLVFTAVKNTTVALLIFSFLLFTKKIKNFKKLTPKETIYLLAIGLIGGALPFYLFFTGLSKIPAINGAMIHKTLVLWVALLALPFLKEKLSQIQIVALLLLFTSNIFIGGFKGFQFSVGELMVLTATIFWAVENILAKRILPTVDPDLVVSARMGIGSLILITISAIFYPQSLLALPRFTSLQFFWLTFTAASLTAYTITWYRALKFAPATLVTSILVASTLITNLLSAIFITHNLILLISPQNLLLSFSLGLLLSPVLFASKIKASPVLH